MVEFSEPGSESGAADLRRRWYAKKVDRLEATWIVTTDEWALGVYYDDEAEARHQAEHMNARESGRAAP